MRNYIFRSLTLVKLPLFHHIHELDGLRRIAVQVVLFHHMMIKPSMIDGSRVSIIAQWIFLYGHPGMNVLFWPRDS